MAKEIQYGHTNDSDTLYAVVRRFSDQKVWDVTNSVFATWNNANIGDYDIWVYSGFYEHPETGVLTPYLADHTVILTSKQVEGVRAYGAIQDEEAGLQALPYFPKSWVEKDPGLRQLLMQSAPLTVPYRVNATFRATIR